jgi:rhodanese-related sulfurtransferase
MIKYTFLIATTLGLIMFQSSARKAISTKEVYQLALRDTNVVILDVRTPAEFWGELGHVKGAMLIPVQELEKRLSEVEPFRSKKILAICRSGNRSGVAANLLNEQGFDAYNVVGGMLRWNQEGLPVDKGPEKR